jgi:hypothetical protein
MYIYNLFLIIAHTNDSKKKSKQELFFSNFVKSVAWQQTEMVPLEEFSRSSVAFG